MERVQSAFGIVMILLIAFAMCPRALKRRVSWRTIGLGLALLMITAVIVLKTPARELFRQANAGVESLLGYCDHGARFLFGNLVDPSGPWGFVFAFRVLPTIIVFAALMSLLYYFRIMPAIVTFLGRFLSRFLGTSGAESFSTVADIFVGQTEAPLVIGPYVPHLTKSELNACMVAGFATTAGGVLAAYVTMLNAYVPEIAGHLIACSVMCAPASLVIAKLVLPESESPATAGTTQIEIPRAADNLFDAVTAGTSDGLRLALNVGAMLIAFVALTAMLNAFLHLFEVGGAELSLERLLGWVFAPMAWLMGVDASEMTKVGSLLGQKTVLTEFVAYMNMSASLKADPAYLSDRSRLIASYALCGFANFASIGIQIGGYSGLAPERRADISRLALRAMFGGALTTCLVAAVAGLLL
jgi:concentrative nucleoside transporter, CNT family